MLRPKVVILGGGVAGMSAAQELAERGFAVEVFERREIPGGKARSLDVDDAPERGPARSRRAPLAGEHGFRFFPGFYKHVVDTMKRIPFGKRCVADNLVDTTKIQIASDEKASLFVPARFPQAAGELKPALSFILGLLGGQLELNSVELAYISSKIWQFLTSCDERRMTEYEKISWYDYIEAATHSEAFQTVFGHGITRSLVAAKARRASTKTIGNIFMQMLLYILQPGVAADRVLNGPTSEVWIRPWQEHLKSLGVVYHLDAEVRGITCSRGRVTGATIVRDRTTYEAKGDYFISALPVERIADLITPALAAADPALAAIPTLSDSVEWMNGIQFYLTEDVPLVHGHTIYLESPWALTSISQAQFWTGYDMAAHGDGRVRGILSVDVSNWETPGLNCKKAIDCSREEIKEEVWNQMRVALNVGGQRVLKEENLHSWFLDPDITDADPARPGGRSNLEPLLVNYVDTWRLRPEAVTRIPNFFLASDYVRTYTDLATMEAANEAARRATNGILAVSGVAAPSCELWPLQEPQLLEPFKAYDRMRFRQGQAWDCYGIEMVQHALNVGSAASAASQSSDGGEGPSAAKLAGVAGRLHQSAREMAAVVGAPELWSPESTLERNPAAGSLVPAPTAPPGRSSRPRVRILPP
jgi:uncharacterized protein with NAD-binding domain and iron-sulfur cluster